MKKTETFVLYFVSSLVGHRLLNDYPHKIVKCIKTFFFLSLGTCDVFPDSVYLNYSDFFLLKFHRCMS